MRSLSHALLPPATRGLRPPLRPRGLTAEGAEGRGVLGFVMLEKAELLGFWVVRFAVNFTGKPIVRKI